MVILKALHQNEDMVAVPEGECEQSFETENQSEGYFRER
jgi:hypothetical protein